MIFTDPPRSGEEIRAMLRREFDAADKIVQRFGGIPTMRDQLFEYAVIFFPKVTKADTDNARRVRAKLLVPPTPILARDEAEVKAKAFRQLDEEYDEKLDQIEVLVVPFE